MTAINADLICIPRCCRLNNSDYDVMQWNFHCLWTFFCMSQDSDDRESILLNEPAALPTFCLHRRTDYHNELVMSVEFNRRLLTLREGIPCIATVCDDDEKIMQRFTYILTCVHDLISIFNIEHFSLFKKFHFQCFSFLANCIGKQMWWLAMIVRLMLYIVVNRLIIVQHVWYIIKKSWGIVKIKKYFKKAFLLVK